MINGMHEMGLPDPEFSKHFDVMVVFRNRVVAEETSELNPRQQTGLQIVRDKGSISTSEYVAATGARREPRTGIFRIWWSVAWYSQKLRGRCKWQEGGGRVDRPGAECNEPAGRALRK